MASREGTTLISPVRIQDDTIPQPVAFANELNGGAQAGATLSLRDSLPVYARAWGMFFVVYNDTGNNGTYQLTYGNINTNISDNGNWKLFNPGSAASNVRKIDQSILNNGSITSIGFSILLMVLINAQGSLSGVTIGYNSGADDLMIAQAVPAGYFPIIKGIVLPTPTSIWFNNISVQSTCSLILLTF